jgi:dienelactone hydrolase
MNRELLDLLGKFPEKPGSLEVQVLREEELPGCKRQLISYLVEEDERIKAYLLRPTSTRLAKNGKLPAILAIHSHGTQFYIGKSEVSGLPRQQSDRRYGLELAERGYVVITPYQLAFEERRPPEWKIVDNAYLKNEKYEELIYFRALLHGSTLQAKYLSDLSCAVDVLCDLESVDANRIGTIGHSLGGQETVWMMLYDRRMRAGVSSCGLSTYQAVFEDEIVHNYPFYVPNLMSLGDMDTFMQDIAPRPLLLACGTEDPIFPIRGVRQIDAALSRRYRELSAEAYYRLITFEGGHSFPDEVRREAYDWLDKHLS